MSSSAPSSVPGFGCFNSTFRGPPKSGTRTGSGRHASRGEAETPKVMTDAGDESGANATTSPKPWPRVTAESMDAAAPSRCSE